MQAVGVEPTQTCTNASFSLRKWYERSLAMYELFMLQANAFALPAVGETDDAPDVWKATMAEWRLCHGMGVDCAAMTVMLKTELVEKHPDVIERFKKLLVSQKNADAAAANKRKRADLSGMTEEELRAHQAELKSRKKMRVAEEKQRKVGPPQLALIG